MAIIYNDDEGNPNPGITTSGQTSTNVPGTTIAGKGDTAAGQTKTEKPDKRWYNPLSGFSSYTYNISLYMITPTAYDIFNAGGRKSLKNLGAGSKDNFAGICLIAQSGGIKSGTNGVVENENNIPRAPGLKYDYYIENLKITTALLGPQTQTATNTYEVTFDIIEPMGFSFVSDLKRAQDALRKYDSSSSFINLTNSTRQFFILGIRFKGYDEFGNLVTKADQLNGINTGSPEQSQGIYERFFDIFISEFKFKIDGKSTTYNVKAASIKSYAGLGASRGMISKGPTLQAATVGDALDQLMESLNKNQLANVNSTPKKQGLPNVYAVEFVGPNIQLLRDASLVTSATKVNLDTTPSSTTQTTNQNNLKSEITNNLETRLRSIQIPNMTPVLKAIETIVSSSTFLTDAITKLKKNVDEQSVKNPSESAILNDDAKTFYWYCVTPRITKGTFDSEITNDWVFNITYVINIYETPAMLAPGAKKLPDYKGPNKRYEFYFSGKNSEVISYDQTFNNAFYMINYFPDQAGVSSGGTPQVPQNSDQPASRVIPGQIPDTAQVQAQLVTSLYDPGSYANAKMTILGDPDFLMTVQPYSIDEVYSKYYEKDGYTFNACGGRVFIEVNFFEGVDYETESSGLLLINEKIRFFDYPQDIVNDLATRGGGVIYHVTKVVSVFNQGKFTQSMDLIFASFPKVRTQTQSSTERAATATAPATTPVPVKQTTSLVGFKTDRTFTEFIQQTAGEKTPTGNPVQSADDDQQSSTGNISDIAAP